MFSPRKCAHTPGSHVFQRTGTIFELNFLFTCFHYLHIEKTAPSTDGHVFSPIWTIFELVRDTNKTNVLPMVTRNTAPPTASNFFQRTGTTFELNQHIIKTIMLTK
ncbi:hypothetical protein DPMN_190358 [Dreissena polymorpha]|uniref:Uncharacterized protein n=1 Tax=Dreissena polymorpha TaxID=45954 RepID=A0A9D4DWN7_DREPO|nr:hypothetical protein DPMN_190358 [Dreissena polymorpha]